MASTILILGIVMTMALRISLHKFFKFLADGNWTFTRTRTRKRKSKVPLEASSATRYSSPPGKKDFRIPFSVLSTGTDPEPI